MEVIGKVDVFAVYSEQSTHVYLLIVEGDGPTLLGRDWLHQLKLDWKGIYSVQLASPLQVLLQKY